jgi:Peptidase family M1 domain
MRNLYNQNEASKTAKTIKMSMKNIVLLLFSLFLTQKATAQKAYFQQEANYQIAATLDDKKHQLTADWVLEYKNNSPDALTFIYLLLPANAYGSQRSAFAKQELAKGKTRFYFAETKEMGNFSNLNIQIEGKRVEVDIDRNNPDVAKIKLARPIAAGESVKITTPFQYKIPAIFSRGGHAGQQYLMTQWYPRVAVYDRDGWHPQPYLDQGEFYAEFGKFDITLTLPENYVVGATGSLETASERDFLAKKAVYTEGSFLIKNSKLKIKNGATTSEKQTNNDRLIDGIDSFPKSSERLKTIRYTAENVLDFAWFADKRFMVLASDTALASGRKIGIYTFFAPKFLKMMEKSAFFAKRSIAFYSEHVGEYPHPQASVVMADEGFGGGMEYPMITVLSGDYDPKSLDGLIAHELGHNWFQGILASNERDHAWMDEGLNTYHDNLYSAEFYGKSSLSDFGIPKLFTKGSDLTESDATTQPLMFEHRDQAPETTSDDLTPQNYLLGAYEKPAMGLKVLAKHLGQDKFEELMKKYFNEWKFKHPQPSDFKKIWTDDAENVGDILWFFDGLINSTAPVDYKITALTQDKVFWKATVKNVGKVAAPFTVSGVKGDSAIYTTRLGGLAAGEETVVLIPKNGMDMITVDVKHLLPDVNRANNNIKTSGFLPKIEPLRLKLLVGLDNSRKTNIYAAPLLASNAYDGLMLGAWLHNGFLPFKSLEWSVAPMYSFGTQSLAGLGNVNYAFFAGKNKINVGVGARRFGFDYNKKFSTTRVYDRVVPSVSVEFRGNAASKFSSKLQLRHIFIGEQAFTYDTSKNYNGKVRKTNGMTELAYSGFLKNALGNSGFKIALEHQAYKDAFDRDQSYVRATVEGRKDFMYQRGKRLSARIFVGGFLKNTRETGGGFNDESNRGSLGLVKNGASDYHYDAFYLARNEESSTASQQIDPSTEGGMKFVLPAGATTRLGFSNSLVGALNLKMDLPVNLPRFLQLKPYFDIGYFADKRALPSDQTLLMSGGIAWELFGDAAAIYFPVYFNGSSDDPNSFYSTAVTQRGNYRDRITFSLDLRKINPIGFLKGFLMN